VVIVQVQRCRGGAEEEVVVVKRCSQQPAARAGAKWCRGGTDMEVQTRSRGGGAELQVKELQQSSCKVVAKSADVQVCRVEELQVCRGAEVHQMCNVQMCRCK